MSKQALGELAKDFAKGTIAKDSYRKSRTELIKGIVAGEIEIKIINYEPPLKPTNEIEEAITEGIKRDKTQITLPQQTSKAKTSPAVKPELVTTKNKNKKSSLVFILVSIALVLSLIIVVFLFYPKPPNTEMTATSSNTASNIESSLKSSSSSNMTGESLIADFLNEKNWSEESLNKFIELWAALSDQERNTTKQSKRMQRMNDSIYKQFLEGKALASIDSEKALIKQQKLIEFANAIGINDSRLILN